MVHTSGTFVLENVKYLYITFIYIEIYTESEPDIQNNSLLYKIHQECQNTFDKSLKQLKIYGNK